ncbi:glycosyltransferase family 2 protein [Cohaesibacter celericrescens]|uniref:N-acetylglucosaminyltransferase n=1 Tax=Cohaesibacter celericrescens TaxID=2067669 RepID=A0A2N5XK92_9HYPH|nr:glycosyltransferase [Cohaesibacter celericrescens]PLW74858.1 N-acetylglucosaminyltransferase [Cohaesibacter celericrescens]
MTFLSQGPKKPDPIAAVPLLNSDMSAHYADTPSTPEREKRPETDALILPFHLSLLCSSRVSAQQLLDFRQTAPLFHGINLAQHWILEGHLDEALYFMMAAKRLGIPFIGKLDADDLSDLQQEWSLEDLKNINCALTKSMAKLNGLAPRPSSQVVCAPHGAALDRLAKCLTEQPDLRNRVCLTTPTMLLEAQQKHTSQRALNDHVYRLKETMPHMSSHNRFGKIATIGLISIVSCIGLSCIVWSQIAIFFNFLTLSIFLSLAFLRLMAYRALPRIRSQAKQSFSRLQTAHAALSYWPSYTVLVPLYREADMIQDLVAALSGLSYPRDCLDIQLLVEADDTETQAALTTIKLPAYMSIVQIPVHGPRTKPKALNFALSFVQSDLVVIYDAEDRPHPNQLKEAALRMEAGGPSLGCLQGRLAIDNADANFLTRQFALEYAALFDGLLPFLADERLPVPLGGTSNHFRTSILKQVGGWDPYNVTEDADLGLRLTRLGYRIEILQHDTWEEAPERYAAWVKQRSRWFKGWMQTWLVHMRRPRTLYGDLGRSRFLAFQVMIGGMLVSALIHPLYIVSFTTSFAAITFNIGTDSTLFWSLMVANGANLVMGYGGAMLLAHRTARSRYGYGWRQVLAMPLYWLMMTPAAWRAFLQLLISPHHWEKTQHGLSKQRPPVANAHKRQKQGP